MWYSPMVDEGLKRFLPVIRAYLLGVVVAVSLVLLSQFGWMKGVVAPLERWVVGGYRGVSQGIRIMQIPGETVKFWYQGTRRIADLEQRLAQASVDKTEVVKMQALCGQLGSDVELLKQKQWVGQVVVGQMVLGAERGVMTVGEASGVTKGLVVVDGAGVLVGRVAGVGRYTSVILRPYDRDSRIAVRLVGSTTTGVLAGDGQQAQLTEVLQADELGVGEVVVTSGADEAYPEGLVVGEMAELTGEAAEVTKGGKVSLYGKDEGNKYILWPH